jgi:Fe-S-cluster-containing dehydrogenase component/DMSO reductase anchor subunit
MVASKDNFPLLAELLAEQQRLDTPVAQFSGAHDAGSLPDALARHSALIPLSAPKPGEQYAFEVELDFCTGCKSCVAACHSLNGLDDDEAWRDVGLLVSTEPRHPFAQTVTTACHHCSDPACLNGCPVLAYEKDPATGIVRHLDDQCIGCSYCILKCPYDVPKFNHRLGIVRKCDMCHGRLAHGEAPACAQACPTHAIRIVTVAVPAKEFQISNLKSEIPPATGPSSSVRPPSSGSFLPSAPDPAYTQPTTRYVTKRRLPEHLAAGDHATLHLQPAHWPLVFLLTLMPMAVGCGIADKVLAPRSAALTSAGWIAGAAGLALSLLHLGQPLRAWRVFLGWRKSWLSREAIAFGAWFPPATAYALVRLGVLPSDPAGLQSALAVLTAALGTLALLCSVMVYVDTRRVFWRFANTAPRFLGTAAVLGLAGALAVGMPAEARPLGLTLTLAMLVKLLLEARALAALADSPDEVTPQRQTALLLTGRLRTANELRFLLGLTGGVLLPLALALGEAPAAVAWPALAAVLAGELLERSLFFRAVDAPKMPGMPAAAPAFRA